jgi:predicted transposase YdaD
MPELDNLDAVMPKATGQNATPLDPKVENVRRETKLKAVSKLIELGLTEQQIAEALDLPLQEVREAME